MLGLIVGAYIYVHDTYCIIALYWKIMFVSYDIVRHHFRESVTPSQNIAQATCYTYIRDLFAHVLYDTFVCVMDVFAGLHPSHRQRNMIPHNFNSVSASLYHTIFLHARSTSPWSHSPILIIHTALAMAIATDAHATNLHHRKRHQRHGHRRRRPCLHPCLIFKFFWSGLTARPHRLRRRRAVQGAWWMLDKGSIRFPWHDDASHHQRRLSLSTTPLSRVCHYLLPW